MRIGTILPTAESDGPGRIPTWAEILDFTRHAEAVGIDSAWAADHLYGNEPSKPAEGIHEAWALMCGLAAATGRIRLGHLVNCVSFRSPGLLAKMAVTADEISGGRFTLGLGAGWHDPEYKAFGYPIDHRVSRFEEALEIIVRLLRSETVTFDGRYHSVSEAQLLPAPDRKIPVLIAGNKPRMVELTARHADAWNTAWLRKVDERLRTRLDNMDAALRAAGRDRSQMEVTVGVVVEDAEEPAAANRVADLIRGTRELGVDELIVLPLPITKRALERIAEGRARPASAR